MKIKPTLVGFRGKNRLNVESCSPKNPERANYYHENPPKRILNRFFFNSTLWKIRCGLNPKAQAVKKAQRQLRPEQYFPNFFKFALDSFKRVFSKLYAVQKKIL